jgi:hypothetical protein
MSRAGHSSQNDAIKANVPELSDQHVKCPWWVAVAGKQPMPARTRKPFAEMRIDWQAGSMGHNQQALRS